MNPKDLARWASSLEQEVDEISQQIAGLQERLKPARERLELVRQLMNLENGLAPTADAAPGPSEKRQAAVPQHRASDVAAAVMAILSTSGEPMHVNDIRAAMIEQGLSLPGRGDVANIIVHINKPETGIIRSGRGTYALRSWGIDEVPPVTRKRKTRRKK